TRITSRWGSPTSTQPAQRCVSRGTCCWWSRETTPGVRPRTFGIPTEGSSSWRKDESRLALDRAVDGRASLLDPHEQIAAGEMHDGLAVTGSRGRAGDGARPRGRGLPHAALPHARGHLTRPVDTRDLDVRAAGEPFVRLEERADGRDLLRIAEHDGVRVAYG